MEESGEASDEEGNHQDMSLDDSISDEAERERMLLGEADLAESSEDEESDLPREERKSPGKKGQKQMAMMGDSDGSEYYSD